jgi:hypothetical protein
MMAMLRREDVYNFWLLIDGTGDLDCEQCVLWVVCDGLLDNNEKCSLCGAAESRHRQRYDIIFTIRINLLFIAT